MGRSGKGRYRKGKARGELTRFSRNDRKYVKVIKVEYWIRRINIYIHTYLLDTVTPRTTSMCFMRTKKMSKTCDCLITVTHDNRTLRAYLRSISKTDLRERHFWLTKFVDADRSTAPERCYRWNLLYRVWVFWDDNFVFAVWKRGKTPL